MKAYFVKEVQRPGILWDRRLYQVEPPFQYRDWSDRTTMKLRTTDYLLVSATTGEREQETIVLPADENGTPLDTTPLQGSLKGDRSHEAALRKQGCTICSAEGDEPEPAAISTDGDDPIPPPEEEEELTIYDSKKTHQVARKPK